MTKNREQGYGATSIFRQRALRWYTNAPRRLPIRFSQLFHYQATTVSRTIFFRLFMLAHIHQVLYYLFLPLCLGYGALVAQRSVVVVKHSLRWVLAVVAHRAVRSTLAAAVIAVRDPSLLPDLRTLAVYPFYLLFLDFCFVVGHWRSILYYVPFWPLHRSLPAKWVAEHDAIVATSDAILNDLIANARPGGRRAGGRLANSPVAVLV